MCVCARARARACLCARVRRVLGGGLLGLKQRLDRILHTHARLHTRAGVCACALTCFFNSAGVAGRTTMHSCACQLSPIETSAASAEPQSTSSTFGRRTPSYVLRWFGVSPALPERHLVRVAVSANTRARAHTHTWCESL